MKEAAGGQKTPPASILSKVKLWFDLNVTAFDRNLWKIIGANELAGRRLDNIIEEDLANRVVTTAWFTVIEHRKEGCVKFIIEHWIGRLSD
jgi:hypothetical protein